MKDKYAKEIARRKQFVIGVLFRQCGVEGVKRIIAAADRDNFACQLAISDYHSQRF